ncbi:type II secretion system F family protein [Wenzhouxiangella marina]|uniref:Type II secretion system protein n=1 Tax=Wenzhouxiangella marina TaxID=1579979 RepID=A0A0K0XT81_9GAMM|nr:type II secretion system F family protein [Wenzhouxiangella marina]AKS40865.1 Type II secretion system protein [Wenzhouxiangella marina]MBB6087739.1 general secretion pathway protein F [Wenzhouxiangella marina]
MPLFEYKAVSPSGETLTGEMEAPSPELVIAQLQEAGNIPVSAKEVGSGFRIETLFRGKRGLSQREIGDLTQQLSTLLGAGLPLDRSLGILIDLSDNDRVRDLVQKVRDHVREGGSLSEGLEARHGVFSRFYINMVRAGEIGGSLDQTLARMSEYLERAKELKDSVVSAMIYPALLMVMAIASLLLLMVYVIPQFTPMFEDFGGELPLLTRIVVGAGDVLQNFWWGLIGLTVILVIWFRSQMARPASRLVWDGRFLRMKFVGDIIGKIETARLSRTTGTLLVNGVPLLSALSIAKNVMTNTVLSEDVAQAAKQVKTGAPLARALSQNEHFPRLALQMINVGEETGKLDEMLLKVADTYDREVRVTIDRLMSMLVPAMTLGLAFLIGLIVMSVLMAILSINDMVG